jgi:hypothetical protein
MAAIVAGVTIVGGLRLWNGGKPIGGFTPAMAGLAGAALAFLIASTFRRGRGPSGGSTNRLQPVAD